MTAPPPPSLPSPLWAQGLLGILVVGAALTFLKTVFWPAQITIAPWPFPEQIPLEGWQSVPPSEAPPLPPPAHPQLAQASGYVNGQGYTYNQGALYLNANVRYINPGIGDVKAFAYNFNNHLPTDLQVRYQAGLGYYGLYSAGGESHLSACLSPGGLSTVTREQFVQGRYGQDLRFPRLLFWLGGTIPLSNNKCLWVNISMPEAKVKDAHLAPLESTGQQWLSWWQNYLTRFPSFS